jgi:hypothetical protein
MSAPQLFVGSDIAKAQLDVAVRPTGARWAMANAEPDIAALVARLQAVQPTLIVLRSYGGLSAGGGRCPGRRWAARGGGESPPDT